ncbi:MAG TPA: M14 family zinc carboxypeptidase, partial [Pseudomonadales bacterium]|nr:M14 family zinc carboxypeptidase [Pseudomonadales bacterium]
QLAKSSLNAAIEIWGQSVTGKALTALRIATPEAKVERLRILIVGSHHGASEAAGAESLMVLARQILHEDLGYLLEDIEFYLLPLANPDGLEADTSKNANKVNLNRDYVVLSQPESVAIDQALFRIQPHVVLDAHESAALKRNSLAKEGYMTEFEAQFDFANNPAIPQRTQRFCERQLLRPLLARISEQGLVSQRYIREIRSIRQPLTHGGMTADIFRNKAGLCGALSFLLETRMETKYGHYDSFRNIRVRRQRQVLSQRVFLGLVHSQKKRILDQFRIAQQSIHTKTCLLNADYVPDPNEPFSDITLRRLDNQELVSIAFQNHRHSHFHTRIKRPFAYVITDHIEDISALLLRNSLQFELVQNEADLHCLALTAHWQHNETSKLQQRVFPHCLHLQPGFLRIPVAQVRGQLLPQLFEPQAKSSLFQHEIFRPWFNDPDSAFIYRCSE